MRKIINITLVLMTLILTSACHKEINERISSLKVSITELENSLVTIRSNITSLKEVASALEANDNIVDIEEIVKNGNRGYKLTFSSGATMELFQGVDGITPIIGIQQYTDGEYYWTIQMGETGKVQWLTSGLGIKCRATSTNIKLKIEDGWWWWSLDGSSWTPYTECIGDKGKTTFSSFDTSDPFYVTFELANGTKFTLLRDGALKQMEKFCNDANNNLETYQAIVNNFDTTRFIKNIVENVDEDGNVTGYTFTLKGDDTGERTISINNGSDATEKISIQISDIDEAGYAYWMYRFGDEGDYSFIMIDSTKMKATMEDNMFHIGYKDTLGAYCLIVTTDNQGGYEWLYDNDGNLIRLTNALAFNLFENVEVGTDSVAFTLNNSSTVILPIYDENVSLVLEIPLSEQFEYDESTQAWQYLRPNGLYTLGAYVDAPEGYTLSAMVMDDSGYIQYIENRGSQNKIYFKTSSKISDFVSIAVFLTWKEKTLMKVLKFQAAPEN